MMRVLLLLPVFLVGCADKDSAADPDTTESNDTTTTDSTDDWLDTDTGPVEFREDYACGWDQNDPGDLAATGSAVGDTIADWSAPDQCDEPYRIWDGAGNYTLLLSVAFW